MVKRTRGKKVERTAPEMLEAYKSGELTEVEVGKMLDRNDAGKATEVEFEFLNLLVKHLTPPYEVPKRTKGAAVLYTHRWESSIYKSGKNNFGVFTRKRTPGIKFVYPNKTCRTRVVRLNQFESEMLKIWHNVEQSDQWVVNIQTKNHATLDELLQYIYDDVAEEAEEAELAASLMVDEIETETPF